MCRLLGYVTRQPVKIAQPLADIIDAMVDVSHLHGDGWGFAWYDEKEQLQLSRAPEAAHSSSNFPVLIESITTDALISHVRWASPGFIQCLENTHPFTYGDYAFAHNGALSPNETLETLIAPHLQNELIGSTDSERYFMALVSALETSNPVEAFQTVLGNIQQHLHSSSLNCLLLTPDAVYALSDFDPNAPMTQKEPDYFHLHYRVTPDAVTIASTGLGQDNEWETLDNGQLLIIKRGTLNISIVNINQGTRKSLQEQDTANLQR